MDARSERLAEFTKWCAKHIRGDEKGEAQVFLDRLFQAFGLPGVREVGATLEHRVKKPAAAGPGTSFADLVWEGVVLIEMKKRGEDLSIHLQQAFDYWTRIVPNRPSYVVLCNFDEFRIYDFDQDINQPLDVVPLSALPDRYGPLAFLFPTREEPVFGVDRVKVTRQAADLLAAVYRRLAARREVGPETAQRFVLQTLVCLFSEDIDLLPKHFFTRLLEECTDPPKAFDLLDGLFRAMNARGGAKGGRFKDVQYFNGGIFAQSAAVELDPAQEVAMLRQAAAFNWAHVSPDIFGTIFQHSMDAEERHAMGAHYTSPTDIMRIVGPTIVQPFTRALEKAGTLKELTAIRDRLTTLRVLDPACGSGNFLYIAYREMRRLEAAIIARQSALSKRSVTGQQAFAAVSPKQFFGMDILPFAVELAKVTLSLAPKLASDELHTTERALPLDNLDANITTRDALITPDPTDPKKWTRTEWPAADVIIGNPPFLGAKRLKPERGADYVNAVRGAYPEVPGMADYCVYWIRRSHDHLPAATPEDPFKGRAGLVGTQNIRNNQSRVGGLDHVVKDGVIVEAVENQPWSGEANVHVSIANWVKKGKGKATEASLLIPSPRRLWSKIDAALPLFDADEGGTRPKVVTIGKRGKVRKDKSYEMAVRDCDEINSTLSDETDTASVRVLACNTDPQRSFVGLMPGYLGYLLSTAEARGMLAARLSNREVLFPYVVGREFVAGDGRPDRWIIDFFGKDMLQARAFAEPFLHIQSKVLPEAQQRLRDTHADMKQMREDHLQRWWTVWSPKTELRAAIRPLGRFVASSRIQRQPFVFQFMSSAIRPSDKLQVFAFADDYSFGIIQSKPHCEWFRKRAARLKVETDFNYSGESVFDTFPWPQSPTKKQVRAVAAAGREVRRIRAEVLLTIKGGLRALYRTLELPGKNPLKDAHAALDAAVLDAYGFSPKKDLLKQLLDLNLAVAKAIDKGEVVTAPGVPTSYGDPADLITDDCIKP